MIENDDDYNYDYDFNILKHNTKKYINILNILNRRDLTTNEQILYYKLTEIYLLDDKLSLKQIIQYNEIIISFHKYYNFIILENFII